MTEERKESQGPDREVTGEQAVTGGGSQFGEVRKGLDVVVSTPPETTPQPTQSASDDSSSNTPTDIED